ncbi:MAG: cupin domain-containing protein [Polyangiaceae bacterium]
MIEGTDEEFDLMLATFGPGAESPPHTHPVVGLNYIVEGAVESQYEGEPLKTYVAGESYQDPPNRKHLVFRNKSQEKPLRFLVAFRIKRGASFKVDLDPKPPAPIPISKAALYPEGIDYDKGRNRFLLGSFREGAVYEVSADGTPRPFVSDPELHSVLGIRIDEARNRLLVTNSDIGAAARPYPDGPAKLAALGIYDLATGKALDHVDLGGLTSGARHLANDLAIDANGNAYITDSFSPVIYKVDKEGHASIFLEHESFRGEGIALNGIVVHPDGFLIVAKKDDGVLFKVPLDAPATFSKIELPSKLQAADGLVLLGQDGLAVICNKTSKATANSVYSLITSDHWGSADVARQIPMSDDYPTTGTLKDGNLYVVHSSLNVLIASPREQQSTLRATATIDPVQLLAP